MDPLNNFNNNPDLINQTKELEDLGSQIKNSSKSGIINDKVINLINIYLEKVRNFQESLTEYKNKNPQCEINYSFSDEEIETLKLIETIKQKHFFKSLVSTESQPQINITPSVHEWHLHLGLLLNVYERSNDPELKEKIEFLIVNFLQKAAPVLPSDNNIIQIPPSDLLKPLTNKRLIYHRDNENIHEKLLEPYLNNYSFNDQKYFVAPGTVDLLDLKFNVSNFFDDILLDKNMLFQHLSDPSFHDEIKILLEEKLLKMNIFKNSRVTLIDISKLLDKDKMGDENYRNDFNAKKEILTDLFQKAFYNVASQQNINSRLAEDFLMDHFAFFFTEDIKGSLLLHLCLDFFLWSDHGEMINQTNIQNKMENFLNSSGMREDVLTQRENYFKIVGLNSIDSNRNIQKLHYFKKSDNTVYFSTKNEVLQTNNSDNSRLKFTCENPAMQILGQSTVDILEGLLNEINDETWKSLNENLDTRELLQTSLYRIRLHIATAQHQRDDFVRFSQAVELAHYELTTLITLFHPFNRSDFNQIYKSAIQPNVPEVLQNNIKTGLTKSAMNTFAGIYKASTLIKPNPTVVYGKNGYFESVKFSDGFKKIEDSINKNGSKINLYFDCFNPNISTDESMTMYIASPIEENIQNILKQKKDSDPLTVAIDCTINPLISEKIKNLLSHFSDEVTSGKLNFIFFSSGQKLDMFGMDNYYGAPYYIVNNGDSKWNAFDVLGTHEAFQTNLMSHQWFCLAYKYASKALINYREQIFNNTRDVLKELPDILKPGNNPYLKIYPFDSTLDPSFIDINILGTKEERAHNSPLLDSYLQTKFKDKGFATFNRDSFGFYLTNIVDILNKKRINPGLNPEDVPILVEFLHDLESYIKDQI